MLQYQTNETSEQLMDNIIKPYRSYTVGVQAKTGFDVYGDPNTENILTLPAGKYEVLLLLPELLLTWLL